MVTSLISPRKGVFLEFLTTLKSSEFAAMYTVAKVPIPMIKKGIVITG